jgi:hypothetical protein
MRWFWVVSNDNTVSKPLVVNEGWLDVDDADLDACKEISTWSGKAWVRSSRTDHDGQPDDALQNLYGIPIISPRFREALEMAHVSGIQYLPINVILSTGTSLPGFCIANVLNCTNALDIGRSKFEVFPEDYFLPARRGLIRVIRESTLRRSRLQGLDLIRLSSFKPYLYASERVVRIFEAQKFTGLSFHEVPTTPS